MSLIFWTVLHSIANNPEDKGKFGEMIVTSMFTSKFFGEEERYLVNNLYFEDEFGTHQIDHVLVYHKGIFCIETKHLTGSVHGDKDNKDWYTITSGRKNRLYSPIKQNESHVRCLNEFFEGKYPIFSVVVFTKENKPLGVDDSLVNFSELKNYIINYPSTLDLSSEEMQEIYMKLDGYKRNCKISKEEHIDVLHDDKHKR